MRVSVRGAARDEDVGDLFERLAPRQWLLSLPID